MAASAQDLLALENGGGGGGGGGAGDWEAAYDESGAMYYVNNVTGESAWELPEGAGGGAEDHGGGGGQMVLHTVQLKGKRAAEWKKVLEECFTMPEPVSQLHGDTGKRVVFPNVDPVSPLVRVNVLEAQSPLRHKITVALGDKEDEANAYWQPVVSFYVFACEMPCTLPYVAPRPPPPPPPPMSMPLTLSQSQSPTPPHPTTTPPYPTTTTPLHPTPPQIHHRAEARALRRAAAAAEEAQPARYDRVGAVRPGEGLFRLPRAHARGGALLRQLDVGAG